MSDTENKMEFPPIDKFCSDETGLRKWRPVFDTIGVDVTAKGVRLQVQQGDILFGFIFSPEEAAHIIKCLSDARHSFLNSMKFTSENQPLDQPAD